MSTHHPPHSRFQDDLRALIRGDVLCDDVTRQIYSSDASHYENLPYAVVFPKSVKDVVAIVYYAQEQGLTIHPRGAGTGRSGGCLGSGVVLDMTRYMRRVLHTTDETVLMQPGATLGRVNQLLHQSQGRKIGPNPGFWPVSTVGSLIASDGAGANWLKYGFPHRTILKIQTVLANGTVLNLSSPHNINNINEKDNIRIESRDEKMSAEESGSLTAEVRRILAAVDSQWRASQAENIPNRAGYRLNGVLTEKSTDLIPLFAGSEGTLGIITEVEMKTCPTPKSYAMAMFLFGRLDKAMRAIPLILQHKPESCELIDRRRLSLLMDWDKDCVAMIPHETEAVLMVGLDGEDSLIVGDRLQDMIVEIHHREQLCMTARAAVHPKEIRHFQGILNKSKMALSRMPHYFNGLSLLEDTAVPVGVLPSYVAAVQNLFKKQELTPSFFGHVGHGQVSVQPVLDVSASDVAGQMEKLLPEFYDELFQHQGTVSSEQVCGIARSRWIPKQYPELYPVFQQLKTFFDPHGMLNPGKVVLRDEDIQDFPKYRQPIRGTAVLPVRERTPARKQMELQLKWNARPIEETVFRCNGCGECRTRSSALRMCPVFRNDFNEESAPRAKANLFRGVIDQSIELESLTTEMSRTIAEDCLHCHLCRLECPAEVNVPYLAFRSKSALTAAHNLSLSDWFFSHIDRILHYAALVSCPVNWTLTNRFMRWIYEKAFDLSQNREFPKLCKISFLSRTAWYKRLSRPSRRREKKVALFVDTFANYFDPKLADAAVKVLEHNGIDVYVPSHQQASGICSLTCGHSDRFEKLARHNVNILADIIRQGYEIVTLEPTSALTIREEYRYVLDTPDAALAASETSDICDYLYRLHGTGKLQLDFQPIHAVIGYHAPCRTLAMNKKSIDTSTSAEKLLELIPGLAVKRLERGCCGLSWDYGLRKTNARMSLRIGLPLFNALRDPLIQTGATECSSCKMQMEQGTGKNTIHPVKLLALAYQLMPEIAPLLLTGRKPALKR
ncbi:MAG: FAD-binding protein [Planctomycetaceae bacterium]|jgi:FAD/FMN-containing dehydrogenase/Fe-S oxidoreductase|nr:FAD-binding protein [Planctomycetaceae bacterium]